MMWKTLALFKTALKAVVNSTWAILWTPEHKKLGHLSLIVTSDWRFSGRQERSRTILSPVSLLTSKKTCSLSLWKHFSILCSPCSWNFQELKSLTLSAPLLNVVETDRWAQKVLVRSDRQMDRHSHVVRMYICVPFPPSLSDCINLISLGNQAEKRSGGKSNKILFSSSAATAKSSCPSVWSAVHSPGYSAAGRLSLFWRRWDHVK